MPPVAVAWKAMPLKKGGMPVPSKLVASRTAVEIWLVTSVSNTTPASSTPYMILFAVAPADTATVVDPQLGPTQSGGPGVGGVDTPSGATDA
jgi:hypothetical protein